MHHPRRLPALALMLAVLAFMLFAHPYQGVFHDGILYFGQVLLNTSAPVLSEDIFFKGGSQDRYSLFSPVMGFLYGHFGRQAAQVGVLLTSWLLMLGAVAALLKRFEATPSMRLCGLLAFAVMSPIYGGCWIISYTETFVTARVFAEPPLVWSLVALLTGRRGLAWALQFLALLFHPLMALPVMVVSWCFLSSTDRRWLWLLAALPALLLVAAMGVPPLDSLLKTYPPYWRALVDTSNFLVLLQHWPLRDHLNLLQDLLILLAVTRVRPFDGFSRLLLAVVVTTLALFGLSFLGADVLHSILLTQLQVWRVHWIGHLIAMALSPWLCVTLWMRGGLWRASACALVLSLTNAHIGTDHGAATLSLWAVTSLAAWRVRGASPRVIGLVCGCILLGVLALSAEQLLGQIQQLNWQFPAADWRDRFAKLAAFPLLALGGFAALRHLAGKGRVGASMALVASLGLLALAVMTWDRRTDISQAVDEAPAAGPHPFIAHLPAHASIYWPNELAAVWGLLGRPSHYSQPQGAGLLFNRDTALLFGPRKEIYRAIDQDRERCRTGSLLTRDLAARQRCLMPSSERLEALCNEADAPDFVVLPGSLSLPPLASWQSPQRQTYVLYACSALKSKGN
ncbi:hypothetical protein [Roseateles sp.]|uniref:hypothetical protein n=1 Tax=Roseateles sp. TaxID=1971397 RepID=UPI0032638EC7